MKTATIYDCGKCKDGKVHRTDNSTSEYYEVKIKPCNNCKHQYYLKELPTLKTK